jgi:hypothetical protein
MSNDPIGTDATESAHDEYLRLQAAKIVAVTERAG